MRDIRYNNFNLAEIQLVKAISLNSSISEQLTNLCPLSL